MAQSIDPFDRSSDEKYVVTPSDRPDKMIDADERRVSFRQKVIYSFWMLVSIVVGLVLLLLHEPVARICTDMTDISLPWGIVPLRVLLFFTPPILTARAIWRRTE